MLDDATLIRHALDLHRVDGELPSGTKIRLASAIGCHRSTVTRASKGKGVNLSIDERARLEQHIADPGHPLPDVVDRSLPTAKPGHKGAPQRAGARSVAVWLTPAEEKRWRAYCDTHGGFWWALDTVLKVYARRPLKDPGDRPEGGKLCCWQTEQEAIAILDKAIGGTKQRGVHARAAILRAVNLAKR